MSTAVRIENLTKTYTIRQRTNGGASYKTLRDTLSESTRHVAHRILQKASLRSQFTNETFTALDNLSLTVEKGDKLAVIGHNGAGKSTLLKILSQITEPTSGRISLYGRVSSLLEVGTGFHPELTGRENIYLNGSILGMSHAEVRRKFDEIVDFSGVEKFLDTPVKRYSSGMRMRLGFAVAAHLESEILIIDEVLAVGDAAFQQKCLGKMDSISKSEGRTILFVSHNMSAVQQLCNKGIVLNRGSIAFQGDIKPAIQNYHKTAREAAQGHRVIQKSPAVELFDYKIQGPVDANKDWTLTLTFKSQSVFERCIFDFGVYNADHPLLTHHVSAQVPQQFTLGKGSTQITATLKQVPLNKGDYMVGFYLATQSGEVLYQVLDMQIANVIMIPPATGEAALLALQSHVDIKAL